MIKNYTKNLKLAIVLCLAFAANFAKGQCSASINYTLGANGTATLAAAGVPTTSNTVYQWWIWQGAGGYLTYTAVPTVTVNFPINSTYYPWLSVTSGTCNTSAGANVTVTNVPCNLDASFIWSSGTNGAVTFSNNSTYMVSGLLYTYYFGDSQSQISYSLMPLTHTYSANGTYTATATMTVPGYTPACSATYTTVITVTSSVPPCSLNANFISNQSSNGAVNFSNTSTGTSSNVTYSWNFGDGSTTSSSVSPAHTYTANGTYIVSLNANNNYTPSCVGTQTAVVTVTSVCNINANFTLSQSSNGSVTFTNNSTGGISGTSYTYNFGDGTTSPVSYSVGFPTSHTYSANGIYTVTLTANGGGTPACVSTQTAVIVVNSICNLNANFTSNQSGNGAVQFSNTSTGTSSNVTYLWNFGDGSATSSSVSPAHTYSANGTYTVTLSADNNYTPSCVDTKTLLLTISSVCNLNSDFIYSATNNGVATFSNTSTGTSTNTSYLWTFGDGSTSTLSAPSHSYANSGTYTVTLQADATTNTLFPCTSSTSHSIVITNTCIANTNFSLIPSGTPQYWYAVVTNTANIANAEWSWGDGSLNGTGIVTSHTYAAAGTYSICLSVTLTCGATGTYCSSQFLNKTTGESADIVYLNCVTPDMLTTGIKNNSADNFSFVVSPNPNSGEFNINLNGLNSSSATIQVYNLIGALIHESNNEMHNGTLMKNIKLENAPNGVYFIKVNTGKNVYSQKVIVNK